MTLGPLCIQDSTSFVLIVRPFLAAHFDAEFFLVVPSSTSDDSAPHAPVEVVDDSVFETFVHDGTDSADGDCFVFPGRVEEDF